MTVTVRNIIRHDCRTPVVVVVNRDPFAVSRKVRHAHRHFLDYFLHYGLGNRVVTHRQKTRTLPVPRVKRIFNPAVERFRFRRQVTGIDIRPLPRRQHRVLRPRRVYRHRAPTYAHRRRPVAQNVNANLRVVLNVDVRHGRLKDHAARAPCDTLNVKRARPTFNHPRRRQRHHIRLAPVGHAQERPARHLQLKRPLLVHPQRVARQNQRVRRRVAPIRIRAAFHHRPARVKTHARMHQVLCGRARSGHPRHNHGQRYAQQPVPACPAQKAAFRFHKPELLRGPFPATHPDENSERAFIRWDAPRLLWGVSQFLIPAKHNSFIKTKNTLLTLHFPRRFRAFFCLF